jgi:hypothetical protein
MRAFDSVNRLLRSIDDSHDRHRRLWNWTAAVVALVSLLVMVTALEKLPPETLNAFRLH